MKPIKFLIPLVILALAFTLGASKPESIVVFSRGKVVTGSGSLENHKINKASFFPVFWEDEVVTTGYICVYDEKGNKTEQLIPFDDIKFPGWFVPGCGADGMVVEYEIYAKNNGYRAKIKKFKKDKKIK